MRFTTELGQLKQVLGCLSVVTNQVFSLEEQINAFKVIINHLKSKGTLNQISSSSRMT